jgi:hypothetical protein
MHTTLYEVPSVPKDHNGYSKHTTGVINQIVSCPGARRKRSQLGNETFSLGRLRELPLEIVPYLLSSNVGS